MPEGAEVKAPPPPITGPSQASHAPLLEEPVRSSDDNVGKEAPTSSGKCFLDLMLQFTDFDASVFGMPILLKCKADEIAVSSAPLPPQPFSPPSVAKCPRHDWELVGQMHGFLRTGAWQLDTLRGAQMAAQEASDVMAAAMLRQKGVVREVLVWESEVEGMMREMLKLVDDIESNL